MKYGDLIAFEPIDSVKVLTEADDEDLARRDVSTFVIWPQMRRMLVEQFLPHPDPGWDLHGNERCATFASCLLMPEPWLHRETGGLVRSRRVPRCRLRSSSNEYGRYQNGGLIRKAALRGPQDQHVVDWPVVMVQSRRLGEERPAILEWTRPGCDSGGASAGESSQKGEWIDAELRSEQNLDLDEQQVRAQHGLDFGVRRRAWPIDEERAYATAPDPEQALALLDRVGWRSRDQREPSRRSGELGDQVGRWHQR
jgi:uncharacterized protein DUF6079